MLIRTKIRYNCLQRLSSPSRTVTEEHNRFGLMKVKSNINSESWVKGRGNQSPMSFVNKLLLVLGCTG